MSAMPLTVLRPAHLHAAVLGKYLVGTLRCNSRREGPPPVSRRGQATQYLLFTGSMTP